MLDYDVHPRPDDVISGGGPGDELLGIHQQSSHSAAADTHQHEQHQPPPPPNHNSTYYSPPRPRHILLRIPNTAFGIAMGLAGNAIMWKTVSDDASNFKGANADTQIMNEVLWLAALVVGVAVLVCYIYKTIYHFDLVKQEWNHPIRVHFMNAPHVLALMLAIGIPSRIEATQTSLQIVFGYGLVCQTFKTQFIYENWLFNPNSNISCAKPPFLLSTVGWFLLANLGIAANIEESWGLAIPQFCLGIGTMFYLMVVLSILNSLHNNRKQMKGSPALTLLLAPPSVGLIALDSLDDNDDPTKFNTTSSMILGWVLVLFLLFAKIGPRIAQDPGVLGEYWAYVFPLAAVATGWVRYASVADTTASTIVAAIFLSIAMVALVTVLLRMSFHTYQCVMNRAQWGDPLLGISSHLDHHVPPPPPSPPPPPPRQQHRQHQQQQARQSAPLYTNQI